MQYQSLFFEHFSKCPVPVVVIWAVRTAFKDTAKIYNVFQCLFVVLLSCSARKNNNKNLSSNVRRCHFQLLVKQQQRQRQQQQHMSSNGCKKPDIMMCSKFVDMKRNI